MKRILLIFALHLSLFSFSQVVIDKDTLYTFTMTKMSQGHSICGYPDSITKSICKPDSFYFSVYPDSVNLNFISFRHKEFEKYITRESIETPFLNDSVSLNTFEIQKYSKFLMFDLINCSTDTIILTEQDGDLVAIQEAKNAKGKWEPIEYWYYSWCGNSYSNIEILPYHKTSILCPRYTGKFQTKLRLRIESNKGVLISSEFNGRINKTQFKKKKTNKHTKDYINYLKQ